MRHADKTVTVYRKTWDPETGLDVYRGTVIENVAFFSRISTAVSTDGLTAACEGVLRIPMEVYPEGMELHNGDLVGQGSLAADPRDRAEIDSLCPYVFTIVGVTRNTSGEGAHVKVVCK
jgi:hypothetical protein